MLAEDTSVVTKMYEYDSDAKTWKALTPTLLPPCVNEGMVEYDTLRDVVVYTGGTCSGSASTDETYEWSGDNWTKIDLNSNEGRTFGAGLAYDQAHQVMVLYGGFYSTSPRYQTYIYVSGGWLGTADNQPAPRSLFVFASDPVENTVWLFGGVSSGSAMHDLWKYQNGHFDVIDGKDEPSSCASPYGAWDGDRKRLVVFCGVLGYTYEYDPVGNTWTGLAAKHIPPVRSFASLTYDARLKKTILFGGWDATNFRDDTWMWDGQDWTQVKKDPPPSRELASMWYDPILQKTVIFGGMGRLTANDRLTRYNDMCRRRRLDGDQTDHPAGRALRFPRGRRSPQQPHLPLRRHARHGRSDRSEGDARPVVRRRYMGVGRRELEAGRCQRRASRARESRPGLRPQPQRARHVRRLGRLLPLRHLVPLRRQHLAPLDGHGSPPPAGGKVDSIFELRSSEPDLRSPKFEKRSSKIDLRSPKFENRSSKPTFGLRSSKFEVRSAVSEARISKLENRLCYLYPPHERSPRSE